MRIVKNRFKGLKAKYMIIGLLFLMPATILYLIFTVYPFFDSLILSMHKWSGIGERKFVGFTNFIKAFGDDIFLLSTKNSLYIGFVSAFISVVIGIVMAWLLLYVGRKEGGVYRTVLFSPSMIPPIITALLFSFVFNPEMGILNVFFGSIGFESLQAAWLTNKKTVLNCIIFVLTWKQFGLPMVLCFAGFQGIPNSLIEAARLDGASDFGIFRRVLIPLIRPVIELSSMFALMSGLKVYDTIVAMTKGGPGRISTVIPMWIVENAFGFNKFGYASGMSILYVVLILLCILLVKRMFRGEIYEY